MYHQKKWPPIVFALADEDAFAYCDKNPCVECTFRCKRGMEIYAYVDNIGLVILPLDRMEAPGSARLTISILLMRLWRRQKQLKRNNIRKGKVQAGCFLRTSLERSLL